MAVTEVQLDFTYSFNTMIELAGEGTETNPSEQDVYETDATNASSVLSLGMSNKFATNPIFVGNMSVIQLAMENSFQTFGGGSLAKQAVEVQMEGSLIVVPSGSLSKNVLEIKASGTMYISKDINGDASVIEIQMEASGYFGNNLSMDREVIILSMEGRLIQGVDVDGGIVIIPSADDTEYPNISGEEYIVVNLRTKAHSTYKDGERTAVAKTASLNFGSYTEKNVSDLFLLSRALGEAEVVVQTKEDVERIYPLSWGVTTQANLKNKKLPLAKGLRGANWTISIIVPDESHLEVRGIELYVTDLKRHV